MSVMPAIAPATAPPMVPPEVPFFDSGSVDSVLTAFAGKVVELCVELCLDVAAGLDL